MGRPSGDGLAGHRLGGMRSGRGPDGPRMVTRTCCCRPVCRVGSYGVWVCQQRQMMRAQARSRVRSALRSRLLHAHRNLACLRLPDSLAIGARRRRRSRRGAGSGRGSRRSRPVRRRHKSPRRGCESRCGRSQDLPIKRFFSSLELPDPKEVVEVQGGTSRRPEAADRVRMVIVVRLDALAC